MELLTKEIAKEYINRAKLLPANGFQDIGDRRKLRIELQARCNLTELEAVNVINGNHVDEYMVIQKRREAARLNEGKEINNID